MVAAALVAVAGLVFAPTCIVALPAAAPPDQPPTAAPPDQTVVALEVLSGAYWSNELSLEVHLVTGIRFKLGNGTRRICPLEASRQAKLHDLLLRGMSSSRIPMEGQNYLKRVRAYSQDGNWRCTELEFETTAAAWFTKASVTRWCCRGAQQCVAEAGCSCAGPGLENSTLAAADGAQIVGLGMREGNFTYLPEDALTASIWMRPRPKPVPRDGPHVPLLVGVCTLAVFVVGGLLCLRLTLVRKRRHRTARQLPGHGAEGLLMAGLVSIR